MPQFWHFDSVQSGVMSGWFLTCWEACRVAVAQAGMNLSQSIAVFVLEVAARVVRARSTHDH